MKEIHFYKDLEGELTELVKAMHEEYGFKDFYRSHNETMIAIKKENPNIHTYAISALDFDWLLDKGYKIFLHENGKCGELYEGTTELTDKELRRGHDIRKIWIGGGFENYFYSKDGEFEMRVCNLPETIKISNCNPKAQPCVLTNNGIVTDVIFK